MGKRRAEAPPRQPAGTAGTTGADQSAVERQAGDLIRQGRLPQAERLYRQLVAAGNRNPTCRCNLAALCAADGRWQEATAILRQTLELDPAYVDAHYNLGIALQKLGQTDDAIHALEQAIALRPDLLDAHLNLGSCHLERGDAAAAAVALEQALAIDPRHAIAHCTLSRAREHLGDAEGAIAALRQALAINPELAEAHFMLGNLLSLKDDRDGAIQAYGRAIRSRPDLADAHNNLGNVLLDGGDLEAALSAFRKAARIDPQLAEYRGQIGKALLLRGDYAQGWQDYEIRFTTQAGRSMLLCTPDLPLWQGQRLAASEPLLLVAEQGLGDTLQFIRYALHLRRCGIRVQTCLQPKLRHLIQASGLDPAPLTTEQALQSREGHWIPLLSLPHRLGVSPERPLITEPYLRADPERISAWRATLSAEQRPLLAINWQGNPSHEIGNARGRSLPLEAFAPIAAIPEVTLLSLQQGHGSEQLRTCSFRDRFVGCQELVEGCGAFPDTAAIIANCDLVISSDTAVAHLAGALGRPTWLLLRHVPDWRWGLEGERTFWYPSLRLFRQRRRGDWSEVIERVVRELRLLLAADRSRPAAAAATGRGLQPLAPLSLGELIDKITILEIKASQLSGAARQNVENERQVLDAIFRKLAIPVDPDLIRRLREINGDLWMIEDQIREKERAGDFGEIFIRLARSVYQQNDRRAAIKRQINIKHGSALIEEKSYRTT